MRRFSLLQSSQLLAAASNQEGAESRTREVVWFTGIDIPRIDFWTGEQWILRMPLDRVRLERFNSGAPLLKDHTWERSIDRQVGVIERGSARVENGRGVARVTFFDTPDALEILTKVDQGARNVSIEAAVDDLEDVTPKGQREPKVFAATGWEVEALALVTVPADPNAQFLSAMASPMPGNFYGGIPIEQLADKICERLLSQLDYAALAQSLVAAGASSQRELPADVVARLNFAARALRGRKR